MSLSYMLYSQLKDLKDLVLNPQYLGDMKFSECHLIAEYECWMKNAWRSQRQYVVLHGNYYLWHLGKLKTICCFTQKLLSVTQKNWRGRGFKYKSALLRNFNFIHTSKQRSAASLLHLKERRHTMTHNREVTKLYPTMCGKILNLSLTHSL